MRCPTLRELPPPLSGKTGWPWTEESLQQPDAKPEGLPWPKVSVVTPSYNQEAFIEETIRSVLLQGYPNLEYIVIDAGSTDDSVEIIRRYEKWLAYWVSEPDHGQSDAINKGWRLASGEILAWLNSDDIYVPGAVHAAVEILSKHPEAGLVYGDVIKTDRAGNTLEVHYTRKGKTRRLSRLENRIPSRTPQPTTFMRASIIKQVGHLDPDLYGAMDYDLFLRISRASPVIYLPRVQAKMRLYMGTKTSADALKKWREKISVLKKYHRLWFLSPVWFRYLRHRLWRCCPLPLQTRIRALRGLPKDHAHLEMEMERHDS